MKIKAGLLFSLILASLLYPLMAEANTDDSSDTSNCAVQQAANEALKRRLAIIDAAKVNPSDFFSGNNSCISNDLLKSLDMSNLIPDLAGFMQNGFQSSAQNILNQAKQKACETLNDQMDKVIGNINGTSKIGELQGLLGGNEFQISKPSYPSFGKYSLGSIINTRSSDSDETYSNERMPQYSPAQPSFSRSNETDQSDGTDAAPWLKK